MPISLLFGTISTPPTTPPIPSPPPPGFQARTNSAISPPFQQVPYGNIEVQLNYGGDLSIDATGDLVLVFDGSGNPAATQQRLYRLILQSPTLLDPSGTPLTYPDDVFNPNRGAGLRVEVGESITTSLLGGIKSRVLAALASDRGVAQTPAPTVNVTDLGGGAIQLDISVTTIYGQIVTLPSLQLGG